jgi:RNA polymerase sigma factor (sigma-70 family)
MAGWGLTGVTTVSLAASGTEVATFDERYRGLFLAAMRVAGRITGDRTAAEDLAAEAMARAFANWRKIATLPHLDAWVQRVAANLAIDHVRRRRPLAEATRREEDDVRARRTVAPPFEEASASRSSLTAALVELPRRQREVLVLRYLVGLDDEELGPWLGMSPSTARTHVQRGLATLRKKLGNDFEGIADVRP